MPRARFKDTPGLFGLGIGGGTQGPTCCQICGAKYNTDQDPDGDCIGGDTVNFEDVAGLQACDCCFGRIEQWIICRMPTIVPWYRDYLESQKELLRSREEQIESLRLLLKEITTMP